MAEQSSTTLKSYFETGDVPTEAQFAELIDSYQNKVDNNLFDGIDTTLIGVSPAAQGTATAITKRFSVAFTGGGPTTGFILPAASIGGDGYIFNKSSDLMYIYPPVGGGIYNQLANAPFIVPAYTTAHFQVVAANTYSIILSSDARFTPLNFKALISQAGTAAPTATILTNELPIAPVWAYVGVGNYSLTLTGYLTTGKIFARIQGALTGGYWASVNTLVSPNSVQIQTFNNIGAGVNGQLANTPLEILIYP